MTLRVMQVVFGKRFRLPLPLGPGICGQNKHIKHGCQTKHAFSGLLARRASGGTRRPPAVAVAHVGARSPDLRPSTGGGGLECRLAGACPARLRPGRVRGGPFELPPPQLDAVVGPVDCGAARRWRHGAGSAEAGLQRRLGVRACRTRGIRAEKKYCCNFCSAAATCSLGGVYVRLLDAGIFGITWAACIKQNDYNLNLPNRGHCGGRGPILNNFRLFCHPSECVEFNGSCNKTIQFLHECWKLHPVMRGRRTMHSSCIVVGMSLAMSGRGGAVAGNMTRVEQNIP